MQNETFEKARAGKHAALRLSKLSTVHKNKILQTISAEIVAQKASIAQANEKDAQQALELVEKNELSQSLYQRLLMPEHKILQLCDYLTNVANLEDPSGQKLLATELSPGLELYKISCPIGLLAVIFESRPEVVIQVSALALKSGNGVILKGGSEAIHSNRILYRIIRGVLESYGLENAVQLIETRGDVSDLLQADKFVDLIIPRGSNSFVRYIQDNTRIPVLGHADGICHVYLDQACDTEMAASISVDAKTNYPSACNAAETLLVHKNLSGTTLPEVLQQLHEQKVLLLGCARSVEVAKEHGIPMQALDNHAWATEYSDLIMAVKIVDSVEDAVEHINTYGSGHTDSIVSEHPESVRYFLDRVDSACVFHNASTRFSDGFVFGLGAEVGISTNKTHARGPVGLEGLVIYKYELHGNGHLKASFSGSNAKKFTHKQL